MKAPQELSREIIDAPRTARAPIDLAPFIETIKWAQAHGNAAQIPLDPGEAPRAIKRRFTQAVRNMDIGKQIYWHNKDTPNNMVRFVLIDVVTREPKPRKKKGDLDVANTSPNGTATGEGEPVAATASTPA